jgi:hypothetical protein
MLSQIIKVLFSFSILTLLACAPQQTQEQLDAAEAIEILAPKKAADFVGSGPLGSRSNPIKCDGAKVDSYLKQLRGPKYQPLEIESMGSFGIGPFGGLMEAYQIHIKTVENLDDIQLFFDTSFEDYCDGLTPANLKKKRN